MDHKSRDTDRADTVRAVPQTAAGRTLQVLQPVVRKFPCQEYRESSLGGRGSGDPVGIDFGLTEECEHCGGSLPEGSTANRMYCSKVCQRAAYKAQLRAEQIKERQGRKCLWCSGTIPAEARDGTIYCSVTCRHKSGRDMQKKRQTCRQCGKIYRGRGPFCSHACYGKSCRKLHPKKCPICQNAFKPTYEKQVCCSLACRNERAKRMKWDQS